MLTGKIRLLHAHCVRTPRDSCRAIVACLWVEKVEGNQPVRSLQGPLIADIMPRLGDTAALSLAGDVYHPRSHLCDLKAGLPFLSKGRNSLQDKKMGTKRAVRGL